MKRLIVIAAIVSGCAAQPDIPEEARDMDGNGAAMVKMSVVQWLGHLILTAVGNVTVNVKIEAGDKSDSNN